MCKIKKYPRTFHLPWSPGATNDDKMLKTADCFAGKKVVVTVKMDGSNCSLYNNYFHTRSLNERKHWSTDWLKKFHAEIRNGIPKDTKLVIENMYAKHSIKYTDLVSYCYGISVWRDETCLAWNETEEVFRFFNIPTVPVLYIGEYDESLIKKFSECVKNNNEGYVVRNYDSFAESEFTSNVAKYVRENHVSTDDEHWFNRFNGETNEIRQ